MDAPDLKPTRLARARFKLADILARSDEGQTGLVVFAGDAYVVSPITQDTRTLAAMIPALSTDVVPVQGARLDRGLAEARKLIEGTDVRVGQVIVITDSTPDAAALAEAKALSAAGIRISVLAVGTREGAPVPLSTGDFLRDRNGELVVPRLDVNTLGRLAATGGGRLEVMTADDTDIDSLLAQHVGTELQRQEAESSRQTELWRDRGPWLTLALLPFAALAFRRGWLLCTLLACGLATVSFPTQTNALELEQLWRDLWQRPDQQASSALDAGDAKRAASVAPNAAWRGAAQYRAGDFERAAGSFTRSAGDTGQTPVIDPETAHYNRGNALARAGELEQALAAYDKALESKSDFEDAQFNRELVQKLLEEQQQQQKEQQQQQSQDGEQNEDSSKPEDASKQSGESSEQSQGDPSDDSSSQQGEQQQSAPEQSQAANDGQTDDAQAQDAQPEPESAEAPDESGEPTQEQADMQQANADLGDDQRQALEQWLRRIPDDPGGLLRQKFLLEHQRRGGSRGVEGTSW